MIQEPDKHTDPEPVHLQHAAEHERPGGKSHVMSYLVILFAAAFLLMLLSYFMQQRNNQEAMEGLKQSASAVESIQNLMADNARLQTENQDLKDQVQALEAQQKQLEADLEAERSDPTRAENQRRAEILTGYAVLEQVMRDQDYETAAQTLHTLCDGRTAADLDLGTASQDGSGTFDLPARLNEVISRLTRLGYLTADEIVLE